MSIRQMIMELGFSVFKRQVIDYINQHDRIIKVVRDDRIIKVVQIVVKICIKYTINRSDLLYLTCSVCNKSDLEENEQVRATRRWSVSKRMLALL